MEAQQLSTAVQEVHNAPNLDIFSTYLGTPLQKRGKTDSIDRIEEAGIQGIVPSSLAQMQWEPLEPEF